MVPQVPALPPASPCLPEAPSFGNPLTGAQGTGQLLVPMIEGKLGGPAEWEKVGEGDGLGSSIPKPQGQHLLAVQIQVDKELPIPGFMGTLNFHVHPMFPVKILSPGENGSQGRAGVGGAWPRVCPLSSLRLGRLAECHLCSGIPPLPRNNQLLPSPSSTL